MKVSKYNDQLCQLSLVTINENGFGFDVEALKLIVSKNI